MQPTGSVLVYDGTCRFCGQCARWIATRWPADSATIVASQELSDADLQSYGLVRDDVGRAAWWVGPEGSAGGDRAVARALTNCGGAIGVLGTLLSVAPFRWLAKPTYAVVARQRHCLPGASPSCRVVPPTEKINRIVT